MIADNTSRTIPSSRLRASKRGFTLTEIAIVLGIIGVILGAIWVAAAAVYNNMRISAANRELLQITQAMRALYATSATIDPNADMPLGTAPAAGAESTYLRAGVFPADALNTGLASTATQAINPWNGNISINSAGQPPNNTANDSFEVTFDGLPSNACISMLTASSGQGRDPGMWAAGGGAGGGSGAQHTTLPLGAAQAQNDCDQNGNPTAASFWFAIRATN
jgi:prepilin-type N-terminal cleavage/methylation domain-containing protein